MKQLIFILSIISIAVSQGRNLNFPNDTGIYYRMKFHKNSIIQVCNLNELHANRTAAQIDIIDTITIINKDSIPSNQIFNVYGKGYIKTNDSDSLIILGTIGNVPNKKWIDSAVLVRFSSGSVPEVHTSWFGSKQQAINSRDSGIVYWDDGNSTLTSGITISKPLKIKYGKCNITSSLQGDMFYINSSNVTFEGLGKNTLLENTDTAAIGSIIGINYGSTNITIKDLLFSNVKKYTESVSWPNLYGFPNGDTYRHGAGAIHAGIDSFIVAPSYSKNINIDRCNFSEGRNTIFFAYVKGARITNCTFDNNAGRGIDIIGSDDILISKCIYSDTTAPKYTITDTATGIYGSVNFVELVMWSGQLCYNITVENCISHGTIFEVMDISGHNINVTGCIIDSFRWQGLQVVHLYSAYDTYIDQVYNNRVSNNILIADDYVTVNGAVPISLVSSDTNPLHGNSVVSNTIVMNTGGTGIGVFQNNAGRKVIFNNSICENTIFLNVKRAHGMILKGKNNIIKNNHICGSSVPKDTSQIGIYLQGDTGSYIISNEIKNCQDGISLIFNSKNTNIKENDIYNCSRYGIDFYNADTTVGGNFSLGANNLHSNFINLRYRITTAFNAYPDGIVGSTNSPRPLLTGVGKTIFWDSSSTCNVPVSWNGVTWDTLYKIKNADTAIYSEAGIRLQNTKTSKNEYWKIMSSKSFSGDTGTTVFYIRSVNDSGYKDILAASNFSENITIQGGKNSGRSYGDIRIVNGKLIVFDTSSATSTSTGSAQLDGGISVDKPSWFGDTVSMQGLKVGTAGSIMKSFKILTADSTMYAVIGPDTFFIKMSKK
jgi:parallel beta-helix repeat protein